MIKEAYCSFELSKLLKEKGFDEECIGAYSETNHTIIKFEPNVRNSEVGPLMYSVPTHQTAMAWLREHNLFVEIIFNPEDAIYPIFDTCVYNLKTCERYKIIGYNRYSYNDAVEASIKYCLTKIL